MKEWIGVLIAAALTAAAPSARAQCCGDCNGDGTVSVEELVGAVNHALDGCPAARLPIIVLKGVSLPYLSAVLGADVAEGRVDLAMDTDWSGDGALFAIGAPHVWDNRVELIRNGEFLRLIVA